MDQSDPTDHGLEDIPTEGFSRDFRHAHIELVRRFLKLKREWEEKNPGLRLEVSCTYRTPEEQYRLYKKGRFTGHKGPIVTNIDGKTKKSDHNVYPARALDVFINDGGKAVWDEVAYYPLGEYCVRNKLLWGGHWESFQDYPHIYLPKNVK